MGSLKGLQRILRKRLPFINRWNMVTVYSWGSARLPWFVDRKQGMFYIFWDKPKRKNIHPYEYKEAPLTHLDDIIERNLQRLRNETKTYK